MTGVNSDVGLKAFVPPPTGLDFILTLTHTYGFAFARLSVGLTSVRASGAWSFVMVEFRDCR
jgi:hypothetical protein